MQKRLTGEWKDQSFTLQSNYGLFQNNTIYFRDNHDFIFNQRTFTKLGDKLPISELAVGGQYTLKKHPEIRGSWIMTVKARISLFTIENGKWIEKTDLSAAEQSKVKPTLEFLQAPILVRILGGNFFWLDDALTFRLPFSKSDTPLVN